MFLSFSDLFISKQVQWQMWHCVGDVVCSRMACSTVHLIKSQGRANNWYMPLGFTRSVQTCVSVLAQVSWLPGQAVSYLHWARFQNHCKSRMCEKCWLAKHALVSQEMLAWFLFWIMIALMCWQEESQVERLIATLPLNNSSLNSLSFKWTEPRDNFKHPCKLHMEIKTTSIVA